MEMEQLRNNIETGHIPVTSWAMALAAENSAAADRVRPLVVALSQYGVKEVVGGLHNPTILDYFKEIGHEWVKDDETAWCSAFVNWVMKHSGKPMSGKLNARSWMNIGNPVFEPQMGDVVVLWRESPDSWKGHVGLFVRRTDRHIYVLGGNQKNSVNIQAYPAHRLLGFRRI